MMGNREIATAAFEAWSKGTGYVTSLFADDMTWEIVGRSAASRRHASTQEFVEHVLQPFTARFSHAEPFRPVRIRGVYSDEQNSTVVVVWDGAGKTTAGTTYENTYAWVMTFADGKVVEGTAFFDSIAFNELWEQVPLPAVD